jgi:hypothetical protein
VIEGYPVFVRYGLQRADPHFLIAQFEYDLGLWIGPKNITMRLPKLYDCVSGDLYITGVDGFGALN